MLNEEDELNALIKHEERNLLFYVLHYDIFYKEDGGMEMLEKRINFHLDRLIDLYKQRNER